MGDLFLHAVIFAAAFLQGVTGIGFALIAVPAMLLALDEGSPFQIAALLSLTISLALMPGFHAHVDRGLLRRFGVAAAWALPVGLLLFWVATPTALKLFCGVFVAGLTAATVFGLGNWVGRPGRTGDAVAGALAGVFGGALSMLGPTVSIRMTAAHLPKVQNRATVMAFFVLGYPVVFLSQSAVIGLEAATLWAALGFIPATLLGALAGQVAVHHVSERLFRQIVLAFQTATATSLLVDASRGLL